MISFSILSSGSRANSIYIASPTTRVLIDCGLSAKEAAKRLASVGVEADSIDAIVVTHEHDDHVAGVRVFSKRHSSRVYIAEATKSCSAFRDVETDKLSTFCSGTPFVVRDLLFEPFSVTHDASDPVGFRISHSDTTLGVVTDLGQVTTLVRERTKGLSALILESNHDLGMLYDAPYPWELKQRIRGRLGHLSNDTAGALIEELSTDEDNRLQIAVAAHISEKSNMPELALGTFESSWKGSNQPSFFAASAFYPSQLFTL